MQNPNLPVSIDDREFSTSRKGYDKREVRAFLAQIESNFRDLEEWTHEAKLRLQQAELEAQTAKDVETQSVDAAIAAVLESKDRILDRARIQATEIEAEAQSRAEAILDGVGIDAKDVPADLDSAKREAAAIIEDAQRRAAAMRLDAHNAELQLEDLRTERDRVRDEIEALIAETQITATDQGVEIDPVGTLRRAEEQAMEIIADAEVAADNIRTRADTQAVEGESEIQEGLRAKNIIEEAEERVQEMLLMAEEASKRSLESADQRADKRIEELVSEGQSQMESAASDAAAKAKTLMEEARSVRDQAKAESEDVKRRALSLLDEAERAAEEKLAEMELLKEEAENLKAMAAEAEQVAADTLKTAQDGAEALRDEAREFREEAKRKKEDAETSLKEAIAQAELIRREAEDEAQVLLDDAEGFRSEAEGAIGEMRKESLELLAEAEQLRSESMRDMKVTRADEELVDADNIVAQPTMNDLSKGASALDNVDSTQGMDTSDEHADSLEAIRLEAMRALEGNRPLRETESNDPVPDASPRESAPPPVFDYSPSVQPQAKSIEDDNADHDDGVVKSRYARNSAKLPRLGIEPGSASNSIADLRKQLTTDD